MSPGKLLLIESFQSKGRTVLSEAELNFQPIILSSTSYPTLELALAVDHLGIGIIVQHICLQR